VRHRTVWVHPEYGEAIVVWEWRPIGSSALFAWVPFAVEFDLFTPPDHADQLLYELEACRMTGQRLRGCRPPDQVKRAST